MDAAPLLTAGTDLGAALLVWAGLAKFAVPDGAMATLHRLHLPSGRWAARALGGVEIVAGVAIVVLGGPAAAALLALTYTVFTMVAAWQRSAQVACGCFGTARTAVTRLHVGLNAGFAVFGAVGLLAPPVALAQVARTAGAVGLLSTVLLLAAGVALLRTLLERAADAEVLTA